MEQQILYKYNRISIEQFALFEENYLKEENVEFQSEVQFSYDKEHKNLCCRVIISANNLSGNPLLKLEVCSYYLIEDKSLACLTEGDEIVFTPDLLIQFASLCYGTARGIMHAKTVGTVLNSLILPPVYFGSIIDKSFVVK